MERIGLSGIYIFDTFEGEYKRQPTCVEDCRRETRVEWLNSLNDIALRNTLKGILNSYERLGDLLTKEELIYVIDTMCMALHGDAKYFGIMPNNEKD